MSYENAPATRLVATHCCICGRPLVDSDSVECGIGPTCRGGMDPDVDPNWDLVARELAAWATFDRTEERISTFEYALDLSVGAKTDPTNGRKLSNVLTHRIAAAPSDRGIGHLVSALLAMGRSRLAYAIASRLYQIRIVQRDGGLLLRSPYSHTFPRHARAAGGQWDKDQKCWRFPTRAAAQLFRALVLVWRGERAFGPSGEFVIDTSPEAAAFVASTGEREMQRIEAEADRAGTLRDETAKARARGML